ncbi:MAG: hypothetical protein OEY63_08085, partial [Gemmatimonadota bacterium]|nr:hypothetical protein [Gemmatimonadota bacterium]
DHEGGLGVVYRYDNTYRLDDTYYGVDLWENVGNADRLSQMADPANTPATYGLKRAYNLDERGNRTGSTGIRDSDDAANTIYDTAFTVSSDDMNLYSSVDGNSYTYDDIEQMTYDPSTGLYHAYDYRGQLINTDTDSALTSPERIFSYDTQGRRKTEENHYDTGSVHVDTTVLIDGCSTGKSCGGSAGHLPVETEIFNGSGTSQGSVQYTLGRGIGAPGSGSARHPAAIFPGGGPMIGKTYVAELADDGSTTEWRFRHEDQLGSLTGTTDASGYRTQEFDYLDYGHPVRRDVLYDGQIARISSTSYASNVTTITLASADLTADELNGAELWIARPDESSNRILTTRVTDTTTTTIVIDDVGGVIDAALYSNPTVLSGFVVYDFNDSSETAAPANHMGGNWTSAPSNSGGSSGTTTFTDSNAAFDAYQIGWLLSPDVTLPSYLVITARTATTLTVQGDASTLAASGDTYRVHAPPGVLTGTGTLDPDPIIQGTRYLWAQYKYVPPQVGHDSAGTTYGAQSGTNLAGSYYCWNRTYDPMTGRWTTPDPAAAKYLDACLVSTFGVDLGHMSPANGDGTVSFFGDVYTPGRDMSQTSSAGGNIPNTGIEAQFIGPKARRGLIRIWIDSFGEAEALKKAKEKWVTGEADFKKAKEERDEEIRKKNEKGSVDPCSVSTLWSNLQSYGESSPASSADPSGLSCKATKSASTFWYKITVGETWGCVYVREWIYYECPWYEWHNKSGWKMVDERVVCEPKEAIEREIADQQRIGTQRTSGAPK